MHKTQALWSRASWIGRSGRFGAEARWMGRSGCFGAEGRWMGFTQVQDSSLACKGDCCQRHSCLLPSDFHGQRYFRVHEEMHTANVENLLLSKCPASELLGFTWWRIIYMPNRIIAANISEVFQGTWESCQRWQYRCHTSSVQTFKKCWFNIRANGWK